MIPERATASEADTGKPRASGDDPGRDILAYHSGE